VDDDVTALPARMLGLDGFEVLAAGEVGGELELLVQTTDTLTGCPGCGVVATAQDAVTISCATSPRRVGRCCWCGASGCGAAGSRRARR